MLSKELDEALDQYAEARAEHARLSKELHDAKNEWQPLAQAWKECEEAQKKHREASHKWSQLDSQFDDMHTQLVNAVEDAHNRRVTAQSRVKEIISKLTEVNNG